MRNYRQIAKPAAGTVFLGIGKTQVKGGIMHEPEIFVNRPPRKWLKGDFVRVPQIPLAVVTSVSKQLIPPED